MKFTYASYEKLIQKLRDQEYEFTSYKDYEKYDKTVILRHDIDTDIPKAIEMAEFESKKCGVKSTYFVLLRSDFYNAFSERSKRGLNEIKRLGHTIGLHFDELYYPSQSNIVDCIEAEVKMLEDLLGDVVTAVSMHRPSKKTLQGNYVISNGIVANSYATEFFNEFKYVSDSRRNWREDVNTIVKSDKYKRLHILTHPFWYYEEEKTLKETLSDFLWNAPVEKYDVLNQNFTDLGSVISRDMVVEEICSCKR